MKTEGHGEDRWRKFYWHVKKDPTDWSYSPDKDIFVIKCSDNEAQELCQHIECELKRRVPDQSWNDAVFYVGANEIPVHEDINAYKADKKKKTDEELRKMAESRVLATDLFARGDF